MSFKSKHSKRYNELVFERRSDKKFKPEVTLTSIIQPSPSFTSHVLKRIKGVTDVDNKILNETANLISKNMYINHDLAFQTFVGIICQFSDKHILSEWCLYFEKNNLTLEDIEFWLDDTLEKKYGEDVGLIHRLFASWKKTNSTDTTELAKYLEVLVKHKASIYRIGFHGETLHDLVRDDDILKLNDTCLKLTEI